MILRNDFSDEKIIKKVIQGDVDGYEIIVERYQRHVFSVGMRFFKNEDDSYDFTQEVFLKAFNNLKFFQGRSSFRFWLIRIAYNHGINTIKSYKNESTYVNESASREPTPEKVHLSNEIKDVLLRAIEELPEQYRICLDCYFFLEMSFIEISRITDFPVNTIKSHVFRAKKRLRDSLRGTIAEEYHEM